ncbi:hypothetical protein JTB14_037609 [Gonioctena quinquepunctata]|nr:hypothetical protein JTB14_037609 [Gonioctena quinquepunctata]
MTECKENSIPIPAGLDLNSETVNYYENEEVPYKELIGSLIYVILGSWKYLKNVLQYLKGSIQLRMKFEKSNEFSEKISLDDFGSDPSDRKSISGFLITLNKNLIMWKSKKQSIVALSPAESKSLCIAE